jgi:ketosteroid isomerase-like protein
MADSNLDVVRRLFERFEEGGIEAAMEFFSEDFVAVIPAEMSAEPDVYEGHAGVRRYWGAFEGMIADVRYELIRLVPAGDKVIAEIRLSGRGEISGIEVEQRAAVVHSFRNGKVTRMEPQPDLETALRVAAG